MKRSLMLAVAALMVFMLASVVLGALFFSARKQNAAQSDEIAALKAQIAGQRAEIQKAAAAVAESDQKRAQIAAKARAARQSLAEARAAAAAVTPAPAAALAPSPDDSGNGGEDKKKKPWGPFGDSLAKMMKDPAMKNMMRSGQSIALRQMYGDLVKQWSLSPEETDTFYDLLLDKQMAQMDQGMKVLEKGSAAATTPPGDLDAKIKASLGDDLYKQYQDYEKALPAHMEVSQFQQQLAVGNTPPLTPDQSKVLLQAITEERAAQPPGNYFSGTGANANSFAMDPAQVDQMMKAQGDLNAKIDARMANTLSPDQLQALKQQQEQTLSMQRMSMEMAAKMFGPSPTP